MLPTEVLQLHAAGVNLFPIANSARKVPPAGFMWTERRGNPASLDELICWREQYRPEAWAMLTGEGVVGLDFDGVLGLLDLSRSRLDPHCSTPRDGAHVYVRAPQGLTLRSVTDKTVPGWPGLDVLGLSRYAVVSGRGRTPLRTFELVEWEQLPPDLRGVILDECWTVKPPSQPQAARRRKRAAAPAAARIPEGCRNTTLWREACRLVRPAQWRGPDTSSRVSVYEALVALNEERSDPPLDADEVARIVKSAYRYGGLPNWKRDLAGTVKAIAERCGIENAKAKAVLWELLSWSKCGWEEDDGGEITEFARVWRSAPKLSESTGIPKRTVWRRLSELKDNGAIVALATDRRRGTLYEVSIPELE